MGDITETLFVTSVGGYNDTIGHIFHFLHTLSCNATILIKLPSMGNYRAFWMPVDTKLYPKDPLVPIVKKCNHVPGCRYIVVSDTILTRPFDVVVAFNDQVCDNAKKIVRIQYSEPRCEIHPIHMFRMVEEQFAHPCDDLSYAKLCTVQTTHPVKLSSIDREGGMVYNVVRLLHNASQAKSIKCEYYTLRLVQNHFIVIITSDRTIMDTLYNVLLRRRVAVKKISGDNVPQTISKRLVEGGGFPSISNVVIVKDTFLEMAGLLTNATQVIVADSLISPIIVKHLCALSFNVPVTVHRIDTRRNDGNRVFCESNDVVHMLLSDNSCVLPDVRCIETLPTLPMMIFGDVHFSLCQISLFELYNGVCVGLHTFKMIYEGNCVEGWLDHNMLSVLMTYVTDVNYSLPVNEQDIFSLWTMLRTGNQNWLSQVDWAVLTTLLLCKVILGATFDIVIRPVGASETNTAFDLIQFCTQLSHGLLWDAQLHFPGGATLTLYEFSNSLALLCDTNTNTITYDQCTMMVK